MQINRKWKVAVNLVLGDSPVEEDEAEEKKSFPSQYQKRNSIFPEAFTQDMARRFELIWALVIVVLAILLSNP